MRNCLACLKHISVSELLECSKCKGKFHYPCVGIQSHIFKSNKHELERSWLCPACSTVARRRPKNENTPVRPQNLPQNPPLDDTNISIDERLHEVDNILGATINTEQVSSPAQPSRASSCGEITLSLTLEQIGNLLDEKLRINTRFILSEMAELKSTMQADILSALNEFKSEVTNKTNVLSLEQEKLKADTKDLNEKIKKLESEKNIIEQQLTNLQEKISCPTYDPITYSCECDVPRKFVIYGLEEYQYETEPELHDRVVDIIGNILNVNLMGYIEDIRRIGKMGSRRPLMIELLSKKMVKYILQNTRLFKNTGIKISEFLSKESTQDRKRLVNILREERKHGKHAVIRNNKLYIEGKEYESAQQSLNRRHPHPYNQEQNGLTSYGENEPTPYKSNNSYSFRK